MKFSDVVSQEAVKQRLLHDVRNNRIPHALMLTGPKGAGKMPLALALAQYLLCEHPGGEEPCGMCRSCRMVEEWAHPDLHFTFPIIKKKNSSTAPVCDDYLKEWRQQLSRGLYFDVNDWLETMRADNQQAVYYVTESDALLRKLAIKSSQGGNRVIVMWLPERMNQETANKLLKLIEEPPSRTYFIMVCEEPDKVLGTIISRTQRLQVPALSAQEISEALVSRYALPQDLAVELAHVSQGSLTEALHRMAAGNDEAQFFEQFVSLMRLAYMRKIKDLREWSDAMASTGREPQKRFLRFAQRMLRENFIYNFQRQDSLNYQMRNEADFSRNFARFINERNVIRMMEELADAERDIEGNVNAKMVFFDLALHTIVLLKQ